MRSEKQGEHKNSYVYPYPASSSSLPFSKFVSTTYRKFRPVNDMYAYIISSESICSVITFTFCDGP